MGLLEPETRLPSPLQNAFGMLGTHLHPLHLPLKQFMPFSFSSCFFKMVKVMGTLYFFKKSSSAAMCRVKTHKCLLPRPLFQSRSLEVTTVNGLVCVQFLPK